jgi:hypothetical protein
VWCNCGQDSQDFLACNIRVLCVSAMTRDQWEV